MTLSYDNDHSEDTLTCLEQGEGCKGPVEWHPTPPRGETSRPRCSYHNEQRWDRYSNSDSVERFADSVNPPSWFDPSYAGESWDGDY